MAFPGNYMVIYLSSPLPLVVYKRNLMLDSDWFVQTARQELSSVALPRNLDSMTSWCQITSLACGFLLRNDIRNQRFTVIHKNKLSKEEDDWWRISIKPQTLSLAWRLHPNTRNQAKGMLEELLLAVELRIWFERTRSTFLSLEFSFLFICGLIFLVFG